jgi:hypothetical protein
MINQFGGVELLRAAEQLDDVSRLEQLPENLRQPFPQGLPD